MPVFYELEETPVPPRGSWGAVLGRQSDIGPVRLGVVVALLRQNFFRAPAYLAARVAQISLFLGRIKFKYSVGSLGRASTELRRAAVQSECACPCPDGRT